MKKTAWNKGISMKAYKRAKKLSDKCVVVNSKDGVLTIGLKKEYFDKTQKTPKETLDKMKKILGFDGL